MNTIKQLNNNMAAWYNVVSIIALIALVACYVWRWDTYAYTDVALIPCFVMVGINTAMVCYRYSF